MCKIINNKNPLRQSCVDFIFSFTEREHLTVDFFIYQSTIIYWLSVACQLSLALKSFLILLQIHSLEMIPMSNQPLTIKRNLWHQAKWRQSRHGWCREIGTWQKGVLFMDWISRVRIMSRQIIRSLGLGHLQARQQQLEKLLLWWWWCNNFSQRKSM